jgi:hypothetical protein
VRLASERCSPAPTPIDRHPEAGAEGLLRRMRAARASTSVSTNDGYVFDVQYAFMKAGTKSWSGYKSWQTGVSTTSANFIQTSGKGTKALSARLRNSATGMASLWSPEVSIIVR